MAEKGPEERLHALDAVRAIALLLGIVLHGTMSYVPGIAAMGWPIADSGQQYRPYGLTGSGSCPAGDFSMDPPLASLGIYFYLFAIGWLMQRNRVLLEHVKQRWLAAE